MTAADVSLSHSFTVFVSRFPVCCQIHRMHLSRDHLLIRFGNCQRSLARLLMLHRRVNISHTEGDGRLHGRTATPTGLRFSLVQAASQHHVVRHTVSWWHMLACSHCHHYPQLSTSWLYNEARWNRNTRLCDARCDALPFPLRFLVSNDSHSFEIHLEVRLHLNCCRQSVCLSVFFFLFIRDRLESFIITSVSSSFRNISIMFCTIIQWWGLRNSDSAYSVSISDVNVDSERQIRTFFLDFLEIAKLQIDQNNCNFRRTVWLIVYPTGHTVQC